MRGLLFVAGGLGLSVGCNQYQLHGAPIEPNAPIEEDTASVTTPDETTTDSTPPESTTYVPPESPSTGDPVGRVVTILLTLSDQFVPAQTGSQLIRNAVRFASPAETPNVLVILDDANAGEDADDPKHVVGWLQEAGWASTLIDEPEHGISREDLAGYDTVILSNPGHPVDDLATIQAMRDFSTQGFGIIFQGDDMTRPLPDDPLAMQELSRLVYVDNGTSYYGHSIDNDSGDAYAVTLDAHSALSTDIANLTFSYGNDIDTTTIADDGNSVVATSTVQDTSLPEKSAITAYAP